MDKNEFVEELEELALQMVNCKIIYKSEAGVNMVTVERIRRVFLGGGNWFIETGKGMVIGMERLIEVGGRRNPDLGAEYA